MIADKNIGRTDGTATETSVIHRHRHRHRRRAATATVICFQCATLSPSTGLYRRRFRAPEMITCVKIQGLRIRITVAGVIVGGAVETEARP